MRADSLSPYPLPAFGHPPPDGRGLKVTIVAEGDSCGSPPF